MISENRGCYVHDTTARQDEKEILKEHKGYKMAGMKNLRR